MTKRIDSLRTRVIECRHLYTNIDQIKTKVIPILNAEGILRAALFGSVVRGEANEDSDIDLLVELPEGKTLLDLVGLKRKLEAAVGRVVDLGEYDGLHRLLRDRILREQVPIL